MVIKKQKSAHLAVHARQTEKGANSSSLLRMVKTNANIGGKKREMPLRNVFPALPTREAVPHHLLFLCEKMRPKEVRERERGARKFLTSPPPPLYLHFDTCQDFLELYFLGFPNYGRGGGGARKCANLQGWSRPDF